MLYITLPLTALFLWCYAHLPSVSLHHHQIDWKWRVLWQVKMCSFLSFVSQLLRIFIFDLNSGFVWCSRLNFLVMTSDRWQWFVFIVWDLYLVSALFHSTFCYMIAPTLFCSTFYSEITDSSIQPEQLLVFPTR